MTEVPGKSNGNSVSGERDSTATSLPKLPKIISFSELARCGEEVWIENRGELYRLQRTKNGKLIMTK